MKKTIIVLIVLAIIGFGIYYLTSKNNSEKDSSDTNNPPVSSTPETNPYATGGTSANLETTNPIPPVSVTVPAPASVSINIKNFAFSPSTLTVKVGTKVTWTNSDSAPHTVTSDSGNVLKSPSLSSGQSFSYTFSNAGSFSYHCAIHPMMKANIVVEK